LAAGEVVEGAIDGVEFAVELVEHPRTQLDDFASRRRELESRQLGGLIREDRLAA
jgi:hypothetical protein